MALFNRVLVYCSKDREDWENAKAILCERHIEHIAWEAEELPVGGCGCKIDVRKTSANKKIPTTIFRIEVGKLVVKEATAALEGKVRPVQSYGSV